MSNECENRKETKKHDRKTRVSVFATRFFFDTSIIIISHRIENIFLNEKIKKKRRVYQTRELHQIENVCSKNVAKE